VGIKNLRTNKIRRMFEMQYKSLRTLMVVLAVGTGTTSPSSAQPARSPVDVPVIVGGDGMPTVRCETNGRIVGLDPSGDGFLSVRSGPGGKPYREIDRRYNGQEVLVCGQKGPWLSVVYHASGRWSSCGLQNYGPDLVPYAGPCRYGWVHSRSVDIYAG
jgi:hypothetical protein